MYNRSSCTTGHQHCQSYFSIGMSFCTVPLGTLQSSKECWWLCCETTIRHRLSLGLHICRFVSLFMQKCGPHIWKVFLILERWSMPKCISICMYIYMYLYIYIYMYIYVYVYIYIMVLSDSYVYTRNWLYIHT